MSFKNFLKKINVSKGFTLIELLVATSIIVILTVIILASYKFFQSDIFLQQSTNRLIQDIRRMEGMAIAGQDWSACGQNYQYKYGIHFSSSSQDSYILFADCNNNKNYDGNDDIIEVVKLDKGIIISSLSSNLLSIVFSPPAPKIDINPSFINKAEITLSDDKGRFKKVIINKVGLIAIE